MLRKRSNAWAYAVEACDRASTCSTCNVCPLCLHLPPLPLPPPPYHLRVAPNVAVEGHVLNEAYVDRPIPCKQHEVLQLIIVNAPHHHNVDLPIALAGTGEGEGQREEVGGQVTSRRHGEILPRVRR